MAAAKRQHQATLSTLEERDSFIAAAEAANEAALLAGDAAVAAAVAECNARAVTVQGEAQRQVEAAFAKVGICTQHHYVLFLYCA